VGVDGHLGQDVSGAVDQTALPQAVLEAELGGADEACPAVGDDQQRVAKTPGGEAAEEPGPRVAGLRRARLQAQEHRLAGGGDAPSDQDRLGRGARVHLEERPVGEQVVQLDLGQVAGLPRVELGLDRLADPAHRRLGHRRVRAERVSQGCFHVADRQAPHEPGDDQRLQRMGASHPDAQQARGEHLGGATHLRALQGHLPGGRLDRYRAVAVTGTVTLPLTPCVAVPAEELGDLGLQRDCKARRTARRATSSNLSARLPVVVSAISSAISARMRSAGDTRGVTGVGPPS
jgi:hypothetical protein